jgi:hypothetical protein
VEIVVWCLEPHKFAVYLADGARWDGGFYMTDQELAKRTTAVPANQEIANFVAEAKAGDTRVFEIPLNTLDRFLLCE